MRMRLHKPSPAMGVALLALFIALSGTTYAATGGNFILGRSNTAADPTSLSSSATGAPTLNLVNTGGRPAARFQANGGKAVFTVSNSTRIPNLNGDLLDGLDSTALRNPASAGSTTSGTIPPTPPFTFSDLSSRTLTTATPGKVFAFARASFGSPCAAGGTNCFIRVGLYVDDQPVAGSGAVVGAVSGSQTSWTFTSFGVADNIPAGEHTIRIVATYESGSHPGGWSTGNSMIGGISVG